MSFGGGVGVRPGAGAGWREGIWMSSQSAGALASKENLRLDNEDAAVGGDASGDARSMKS